MEVDLFWLDLFVVHQLGFAIDPLQFHVVLQIGAESLGCQKDILHVQGEDWQLVLEFGDLVLPFYASLEVVVSNKQGLWSIHVQGNNQETRLLVKCHKGWIVALELMDDLVLSIHQIHKTDQKFTISVLPQKSLLLVQQKYFWDLFLSYPFIGNIHCSSYSCSQVKKVYRLSSAVDHNQLLLISQALEVPSLSRLL